MLDVDKEECFQRLSKRRIDPLTGKLFNLESPDCQPATEAQAVRLVLMKHDELPAFNKRYDTFERNIGLIEETFKGCWFMLDAGEDAIKTSYKLAEQILNPPY